MVALFSTFHITHKGQTELQQSELALTGLSMRIPLLSFQAKVATTTAVKKKWPRYGFKLPTKVYVDQNDYKEGYYHNRISNYDDKKSFYTDLIGDKVYLK